MNDNETNSTLLNWPAKEAMRRRDDDLAEKAPVADFCKKVAREINRYGVDEAMRRWRVVCDYMQTEAWWPMAAEEVETLFDAAYEERNRWKMELANRQPAPLVQLNNNPAATNSVGIGQADQVIASNMGNVAHTKYQ